MIIGISIGISIRAYIHIRTGTRTAVIIGSHMKIHDIDIGIRIHTTGAAPPKSE